MKQGRTVLLFFLHHRNKSNTSEVLDGNGTCRLHRMTPRMQTLGIALPLARDKEATRAIQRHLLFCSYVVFLMRPYVVFSSKIF
jgi:hypothetical protein